MKTKVYDRPELAEKAHLRLLARFGLAACRLCWPSNGKPELEVNVNAIRQQLAARTMARRKPRMTMRQPLDDSQPFPGWRPEPGCE